MPKLKVRYCHNTTNPLDGPRPVARSRPAAAPKEGPEDFAIVTDSSLIRSNRETSPPLGPDIQSGHANPRRRLPECLKMAHIGAGI